MAEKSDKERLATIEADGLKTKPYLKGVDKVKANAEIQKEIDLIDTKWTEFKTEFNRKE